MDRGAGSDNMLAALRGASALGLELVDAADVYAWGLSREFAALRAVWHTRIASTGAGRVDHLPVTSAHRVLRKAVGDEH